MGAVRRNGKNGVTIATHSVKMAKLFKGELSIDDMDDEELLQMRFKDKHGRFHGKPPAAVPRELATQRQRELIKRGQAKFESSFFGAIDLLWQLANDPNTDDAVRFKAATYIIERVVGKTPEKVEITGDAPWQIILNKIIVPDGDPEDGPFTIPGKVVSGGR